MANFPKLNQVTALAAVPWNAFVAAFMYYTLLAALALSGTQFGSVTVGAAYGVAPAVYGVTLALRLVRGAGAWLKSNHASGLTSAAHSHA